MRIMFDLRLSVGVNGRGLQLAREATLENDTVTTSPSSPRFLIQRPICTSGTVGGKLVSTFPLNPNTTKQCLPTTCPKRTSMLQIRH